MGAEGNEGKYIGEKLSGHWGRNGRKKKRVRMHQSEKQEGRN